MKFDPLRPSFAGETALAQRLVYAGGKWLTDHEATAYRGVGVVAVTVRHTIHVYPPLERRAPDAAELPRAIVVKHRRRAKR